MTMERYHSRLLITNARGGAAGVLVFLLLLLAAAGGGGYYAYTKYYQKVPLRTKLASAKMKPEMIQFIHDDVSPALYHNLIIMDDILVMMGKELERLKRIAKQYPDQVAVITPQSEALEASKARLAAHFADAKAKIEKIYVTWLVDRTNGIAQIRAQRGYLTRDLADALRGENDLVSRIRVHYDTPS
jgi:hypothetical protein